MPKTPTRIITKYGDFDYRIEETKPEKVVSTVNIKILRKEIRHMEEVKARLIKEIPEKKALLKELKSIT